MFNLSYTNDHRQITITVLRLLKDKFHHCLNMCKSLDYQATLTSTIGKAALELIAPDKLIYDYAIEMCQTAALEELFGHPEEVSELPPYLHLIVIESLHLTLARMSVDCHPHLIVYFCV